MRTVQKRHYAPILLAAVSSLGLAVVARPAEAVTQTFTGLDINTFGSDNAPRIPFPNSQAASNSFQSFLSGTGTETFEGFTTGPTATSININFPGAGTATLTGNNKEIVSTPGTTTDGNGRFPISNTKFLQVPANGSNSFNVAFGSPVAAFGFYGVDIGDFGGSLTLIFTRVNNTTFNVNVPTASGSGGSTSGSVNFFGIIETSLTPGLQLQNVQFSITGGPGTVDNFAFDNLTIGSRLQVVPAPFSILGPGLLMGWALKTRKRLKAKARQA